MADIKIPEAPDYAGGVDESYKAQQEELERQQKQAQREQRAAIFNDMAGLAFDALKLHGGLTVKERESEMGKARKRKEELMQRAGAMKAQYAKDRMAARHSQFNSDMQIARMNQDIAAAEASAAAEAAKAKQAQENWQKNYDYQVQRDEADRELRKEQLAIAAQKAAGKKGDIDYDSIYLEAIATDPDLRAEVERDILDDFGKPTGQKTSYLNEKSDARILIAKKFLRNQAAGKYKVSATGERAGGLLGTQGGFKDLGAKDVKGKKANPMGGGKKTNPMN
jgi:hypothetical protein